MVNIFADYSVYWASGDPDNPSQVNTDESLASSLQLLQGCPKDDLCISFRGGWSFNKIKKFINELTIIE